MRMVVVGFSYPKSFKLAAWLIKLASNNYYSHSYIGFYSEDLRKCYIYHATTHGVSTTTDHTFFEKNQKVTEYVFSVDTAKYAKLVEWAYINEGKKYGFLQVFGLALKKIAVLFDFKLKQPFGDGGQTYFCNELAASAVEIISDFKIADKEDYDLVTFEIELERLWNKLKQ